MNPDDLIARVRAHGFAGITQADRDAFRYRLHQGRRVRGELVDRLLTNYGPADLPLLRELIREEIAARREHDGCGKILFALALMLSALGEVQDVLLVHSAKYANMDAGCMIERCLLRMGRSEAEVLMLIRERLGADPTSSDWPVDRVLEDVADAFAADDHPSAEACVEHAVAIMHTYDEHIYPEDPDDASDVNTGD